MELQSPCFRVRKAQIALYWRPSCYNPIPTRHFLARDEALGYRNADLLVNVFGLFSHVVENESVLFFGSMSSSKC